MNLILIIFGSMGSNNR